MTVVSRVLSLLLLLGVFAGLWAGVVTRHAGHEVACETSEHCCESEHEGQAPEEEHGPDCPPGPHEHHHHHHSHGSCCAGLAMVLEDGERCRLAVLVESRTAFCFRDERLPDGPVLLMDKPPLI